VHCQPSEWGFLRRIVVWFAPRIKRYDRGAISDFAGCSKDSWSGDPMLSKCSIDRQNVVATGHFRRLAEESGLDVPLSRG
jgi:hypothetical protein